MVKQSTLVKIEHKVGDKVIHLMCDADCSIAHVQEALCAFMTHAGNLLSTYEANKKAEEEKAQSELPVTDESASDLDK